MSEVFEAPAAFRDLRIVLVRELPGFHNPFRCDRRELFEAPVRAARASPRRGLLLRGRRRETPLPFEREVELMRDARSRLTAADVAGCRYHDVDWRAVSAVACGLVQSHGPLLAEDDVQRAGVHLCGDERGFLWSLFDDPIVWHPGAITVTNGQHRACGLWFSAAERVPVAPGAVRAI